MATNSLLIALVCCICLLTATHSRVTPNLVQQYQQSLQQLGSKTLKDLSDIYYKTVSLVDFGGITADKAAPKEAVCNYLKKVNFEKAVESGLGSEYLHLYHLFGCPEADLKSEVTTVLKAAQRGDRLDDIHHALQLASSNKAYNGQEVKDACSKVLDLVKEDGTAKTNRRLGDYSLTNTVKVLDVLRRCKDLQALNTNTTPRINKLTESILEKGRSLRQDVLALTDGDFFQTTSSLLHSIQSLNPSAIKNKDLSQYVNYLRSHSQALETPERAYLYHRVGQSFSDAPVPQLDTPVLSRGKDTTLRVRLANLLGGDFKDAANARVKGSVLSGGRPVVSDLAFTRGANGVYEAKLNDNVVAKPGHYELKLNVATGNSTHEYSEDLTVKTPLNVNTVRFDVTKSQDRTESPLEHEIKVGETYNNAFTVNQGNYIHIEVKVPSDSPSVGLIGARLVNANQRFTTGLVSGRFDRASNVYRIVVDLGDPDHILPYNGNYNLDVIISGGLLQETTKWTLAKFDVKFVKPADKAPITDADISLLPEIHHQFPGERRRPSFVVTGLFDLAVIVAVAAFFIVLVRLGVNTNNLPKSFVGKTAAVGLLAAILSLLGTLTLFWFKINIFETVVILLLLAVPTVVVGNIALKNTDQVREKTQ